VQLSELCAASIQGGSRILTNTETKMMVGITLKEEDETLWPGPNTLGISSDPTSTPENEFGFPGNL
jgi:hypothetical protein